MISKLVSAVVSSLSHTYLFAAAAGSFYVYPDLVPSMDGSLTHHELECSGSVHESGALRHELEDIIARL